MHGLCDCVRNHEKLTCIYLKGSIAAAIQATMGSVSAGSVFACLQSAGMAGYGAAVVNAGVSMAGGVAMAANMASNFFRRMESVSTF